MLYGIKISIKKIDSNPVAYLGLTKGEELPKGLGTGISNQGERALHQKYFANIDRRP